MELLIESQTLSAARNPGLRIRSLRRIVRKFRRGAPAFDMHVVPRPEVEQAIAASDGLLVRAADDNAAGPGWLSYTYVCSRLSGSGG